MNQTVAFDGAIIFNQPAVSIEIKPRLFKRFLKDLPSQALTLAAPLAPRLDKIQQRGQVRAGKRNYGQWKAPQCEIGTGVKVRRLTAALLRARRSRFRIFRPGLFPWQKTGAKGRRNLDLVTWCTLDSWVKPPVWV